MFSYAFKCRTCLLCKVYLISLHRSYFVNLKEVSNINTGIYAILKLKFKQSYWIHGWENIPYTTIFGCFYGLFNDPYMVQKVFTCTKTIDGTWRSTHVFFHLVKKPLILVKNDLKRLYGWYLGPFVAYFMPQGPLSIGFTRGSHIAKWSLKHGEQSYLQSGQKQTKKYFVLQHNQLF